MAEKIVGWHAENIKAELRKCFGSLRRFAKTVGVSPQAVSDVFLVVRSTSKVELLIAQALDVTARIPGGS